MGAGDTDRRAGRGYRSPRREMQARQTRDRIVEMAFERGILLLGAGPTSIRISPPLVVSREEADVAIDVLEDSIAAQKR